MKHGIERRITARAEKLWILPTENHICNAQRTHSKTGSTLRLIYHSRILRLRTELYFWLGEKVSLNKSDVLIVYHQDYGNDNKQDCD